MKTIHKFPLKVTDRQTLVLPLGARILTVQAQRETPCIWAEVDAGKNVFTEQRTFLTFGTGHDMPDLVAKYVGTYQLKGGELVFHVYEEA